MIVPLLTLAMPKQVAIHIDRQATAQEVLAAREIERYIYLRTGKLLRIERDGRDEGIVVALKSRASLRRLDAKARSEMSGLKPQQYVLSGKNGRLVIAGGDGPGVLYGAYRFAETLGVRFYLHGDVIPDQRIPFSVPNLHEIGRPLFAVRGINPFHDFPEGPDWWNRDNYLAVIGQLAKLRMNFIGLHTYPEGGVGPEPEVWIGEKQDVNPDGTVKFSYPSSWANTARPGSWGYVAKKTSAFDCGAAQFFASDDFGPAVMAGLMPKPVDPSGSNLLFDRAGLMFRDAFNEAKELGVKTCVGTETPLTIPKLVQDRLRDEGKNPADLQVVRSIYEGMFSRIARLYPVDYYWLWTPEGWTWSGNTPEQLKQTTDDIQEAIDALHAIGNPFRLATCGWVLGPQNDRSALDRILPKSVAVSAINREVGNSPVDPAFGEVSGRSKWAIPWMENDPTLTAPQLWAGRMLYDAADAKRMGCDGLLGIHWRTKILAPNISALALAGWDQSWKPKGFDEAAKALTSPNSPTGAIGGNLDQFTDPVAGTDLQPVYRTVRYDMSAYDLAVPNGSYVVTLRFNEPFYGEAGKRVFGVKLQGRTVIDRLDMFAKAGKNRAIDYTFPHVAVSGGRMRIDFVKEVEFPCIAGIEVTAPGFSRKINCGGHGYDGFVGELDSTDPAPQARSVPTGWFYEDFARANFGDLVAKPAGAIFSKIDGMNLPRPATWITGPGDIAANPTPWSEVGKSYAFVDELAALRSRVRGAGNLDRFDYWLNMFRSMREMGHAGCERGELDRKMTAVAAETDPGRRKGLAGDALTVRIELARTWERLMGYLEAAVSTPGEFGTVSNLQQHVEAFAHFLDGQDAALSRALGRPLPPTVNPSGAYTGPSRVIVPTLRTLAAPGERISLEVILPTSGKVAHVALHWRRMGSGSFAAIPVAHLGRAVYRADLPAVPSGADGIEYYVSAEFLESGRREKVTFPATAPEINQTVVVASSR